MSSLLVRCYPATWRARYGAEFEALLEEMSVGPLDVADILLGALDAHLRLRGHETNITRGKGFDMSLRIGGIAAILGAVLWAVAGVANSGAFVAVDQAVPTVLLATSLPVWLVAMACMSAFQARTNPTVAWAAFLVPAVGIVASVVGMIGVVAQAGEVFWLLFGLGVMTATVGSVIFAVVTYQTGVLSRTSAVVLATGLLVTLATIASPNLQVIAATGLAAIAVGWFALGVQAIRLAPPAAAQRAA
jgi:hypothetical protein